MRNGSVIAGNQRTGRLMAVGGGMYLGERLAKGGKFETRQFKGTRGNVMPEWEEWRDEVAEDAFIRRHVKKRDRGGCGEAAHVTVAEEAAVCAERGEAELAANGKADVKAEGRSQTFMYVLAFHGQRTSKAIAAFDRMEDAIDMSDALTVALDATGMEGKYVVDELPVWGRRGA